MTINLPDIASPRIAIIGLGYVGLPLAVEFGKQFPTLGYDINTARVGELRYGKDSTLEVEPELLAEATHLGFTDQLVDIVGCNDIITVPTPIDADKRPDLNPLVKASEAIGSVLKPGDTVIYESTVYPGCTEEVCVPILERVSGIRFEAATHDDANRAHGARLQPQSAVAAAPGRDVPPNTFAVGYSPERINPGDKHHRLPNIPKVTSGSTPATADFVDALYRRIITAGTHKASSLKVAEASKVIENTQRDVNIALMNEFAMIFHRLGIDTNEVLEAAGTKWNFLPFKPGLVGGHCIGVDPYYLIQKAQSAGYYPDILLACRRINNAMGQHVAAEVIKLMIRKGHAIAGSKVLVLGFTFKENCPDLRNTRVVDLVHEFREFGAAVDVYDPWANGEEARHEYDIQLLAQRPWCADYDAVVIAVAHDEFRDMGVVGISALAGPNAVLYDIKGLFPGNQVDGRL